MMHQSWDPEEPYDWELAAEVSQGLSAIGAYLGKWAAFEVYCKGRRALGDGMDQGAKGKETSD